MNSEKIYIGDYPYYVNSDDLNNPHLHKLFIFNDSELQDIVKDGNGTVMVRKDDLEDHLKENWEWDPKFPKPGTEIIFRTSDGTMMGVVKDVISTHTLIVDAEDGREVEIIELLDGGWMEREEHRARTVHEWGGAGFSYGGGSSIFPVNRGGQMNRGGFGGASNLGGPNMMYTYEIKPLNRLLQPKPSDFEEIEEPIHDGHTIEGEELNKRDGKVYIGSVIKTDRLTDGSVNYYVILDDESTRKIKIDPTTAVLLSGEAWIDSRNHAPGRDEADLVRAGQMKEEVRAKTVNESITKPIISTVDEFMTWYYGDESWEDDWQAANVMEVNDKHAQEDGENGMTHLRSLSDNKQEKIEIYQNQFRPGDWDIFFKVGEDEISFQSAVRAFSDEDDF